MTIALEVRNLNKSFGSVVAARKLDLEFAAGDVVSIIGANGAGKTTFINMVTGYTKPDTGSVRLFGLDITGWPPRRVVRAGLGRSFQIAQLFAGLSVWENVMTAAVLGDDKRSGAFRRAERPELEQRCDQVLAALGLSSLAHAFPENLAGGTRKLLDIAMAVVSRPKLLLLDEPTSGVSEQEKIALMEKVLQAVGNQQMTTILVEHDMEIVRHFSRRVLAFVAGEVVADGTPNEVFSDADVQEAITGHS